MGSFWQVEWNGILGSGSRVLWKLLERLWMCGIDGLIPLITGQSAAAGLVVYAMRKWYDFNPLFSFRSVINLMQPFG